MKVEVEAKELKKSLTAMRALQGLAKAKKTSDDDDEAIRVKCMLEVDDENQLHVESTTLGAHVRKTLPAKTLRPGKVGVDLIMLTKLHLSGKVLIEHEERSGQIKVKAGKAEYNIAMDDEAVNTVQSSRPNGKDLTPVARIPTKLLTKASSWVEIKPGLNEEDMRMQFEFKKQKTGNRLDLVGLDHFSYGWFSRTSNDIKVKTNTRFIIRATSLKTVLGCVSGEHITIGVQQAEEEGDASMVRLKADDADIFYPTLDLPFYRASMVHEDAVSGERDSSFVASRKHIQEAINTVKQIAVGNTPMIVLLQVTDEDVQLGAMQGNNTAIAQIKAEKIETKDDGMQRMALNLHYLSEMVDLAPDVAPLRIESWNKTQTILQVEGVENGTIEYCISQVDAENLPS